MHSSSPSPIPRTVDELDELLSAPTAGVIETLRQLPGDIVVLGAGGKMGPTLARMARRAADAAGSPRRILAVSRFPQDALRERLASWGIDTIRCNLLDEQQVDQLPEAPYVINMAGYKFGAQSNPPLTWAMNCYLPALVCRRFRHSRIVAFSSGNVYGLVPVSSRGSVETDEPRPVGEYAITILGRERMYEYFSHTWSIPTALLRLNYATELRYGVLVDVARQVWNNEPIDLTMGYVNVIWQADANAMSLQALAEVGTPARIWNVAGHERLRIRDVAEQFGEILQRRVQFQGQESADALLNDARASYERLGQPQVSAQQMIGSTAAWIMRGGESLNKPTHFDSRDGRF